MDLSTLESLARARTRDGAIAIAGAALDAAGVVGGALGVLDRGELRVLGHARRGASEAALRALRECAAGRGASVVGGVVAVPFDDGDERAALVAELASEVDAPRWQGWATVLAVHIEAAFARARAEDDARRGSRAIETLILAASHELRSPLATVAMWTHVLLHGDEATRHRAAEAIGESLQVHVHLVGELVDVARAASGSLPVTMASTAIAPIARGVVESLGPGARARGVDLALDATGDALVWGDARRLGQALDGLVSHALAATPLGGRVALSVVPGARSVRIAAAAQAHGASSSNSLGALGIALAREVTLLHGGSFALERTPMGGYEHVMQLPRSAGRGAKGGLPLLEGARVHLVLADGVARRALEEVLAACGAAVTTDDDLGDVPDGSSLVCDLALAAEPGGVARWPAVAVLTGESRAAEERARALGFRAVVARPVDALEVAMTVEAVTRAFGTAPASARDR